MTAEDPADLGVVEAAAELSAGRITAEELTAACLDRITLRDVAFGAWLDVYEEHALASARRADARRRAGNADPLTGVPVGLKAVIGAAGLPLTADSAVLAGNVAGFDSTAWARLHRAGMVLLGHLHCGEFACGTWGSSPWHRNFSPGGSSSGSAIAVATRTVPATLGSDARGSIRMPAGFNGVTGLKPSFGLVSTSGCIPITFTYDVVGPLGRSAADCSMLLTALAGPDPADPATLVQPPGLTFPAQPGSGRHPLAGTRIGIPRFPQGLLTDGVEAVFARFEEELAGLGATLVPFDRPANPLEANGGAGAGWKTIFGAEALAIHAQFEGRDHLHRPEFSEVFNPMVETGGTAVEYVQGLIKRAELVATWKSVFDDLRLDAVVEPGSAGDIPKLYQATNVGNGPLDVTSHPLLCGMWSDANFPALSVPAGVSHVDGGPVGIQVVGLPWTDPILLQIGIDYQAATDYHLAEPPRLREAELEPYPPATVANQGDQPRYLPQRSPLGAVIFEERLSEPGTRSRPRIPK